MTRTAISLLALLLVLCPAWTAVKAQQAGQLQHAITPPAGTAQEAAALGISCAVNAAFTVAGCPFDDIGGQDSGVVKVFDTATGALLHVLVNPSPAAFDYFGFALALSGSKLVVGAYLDDTDALNAGIAYVYDLAGATPSQPQHVLRNPAPSAADQFGYAVAASGQYVAVAAPLEDHGATNSGTVYVYDMGSAAPTEPALTVHNPAPVSGDQFGYSIALDGTHLLAGVPLKDIGASNAGSVVLFNLAGANPTTPVASLANPHPASSDQFGNAVALHGQRFVVGAALDDETGSNSGRAYVYDFSGGAPSTFSLVLENPAPAANDQYGYAVAIHGSKVTVGCPYDDTGVLDSGRAYVYDLHGAQPATPVAALSRPLPVIDDRLSLSLAMHGNRVVTAVPYDDTQASNAGALAVFDLASSTPGMPVALLSSPSPAAGDLFGAAVAVSGSRMVVGSRLEDTGATNAGSAFIFDLAGATPATPVLVLRNPNPLNGDEFGQSVAISGNRVAVSAPYADPGDIKDAGTVYVYDLNHPQPHLPVLTLANPEPAVSDQFGSALAMSGNRLVVGARLDDALATNSGSAYVYDLNSANPATPWLTLRNPTPAIGDFFGRSVAIHQNLLVVGASADDTGANDAGSAYVYNLNAGDPATPLLTLNNPEPAAGDQFGYSVAVSGAIIAVGANTDDANAIDSGSVYVYDLTKPAPSVPAWTLRHPQPMANDQFGAAVAVDGKRVAVGAHLDDLAVNDAGSVHVFDLDSATPTVPDLLLAIPGATQGDQLGIAVAMAGGHVIAGASGADVVAWDKGAAYVFRSVLTIEPVDIAVEQPAGVELVSGISTVSFGSPLVGGAPADLTWLVRSAGLEDLETVSASISGTHAADFTIMQTPAPTVAPGTTSTMVIRFTPGAGGSRSAQLHITSNDPNESPFIVTLSGTGVIPAPEIAVEQPAGTDLTAGVNTVNFGGVVAAAAYSTREFTVRNAGTANLTGIALSIAGTQASEFSVDSAPAATLAPGASTTFTLRFTPLAGGLRQAKVSIASSDADENPFDIFLSGTGIVFPDLRVEQPITNQLANGAATIDFGQTEVAGESVDRIFTLRNNGTGVLSGLAVNLGGAHPGDYVVTVPPPASIAPGGSSFFTIRFAPMLGGTRQATASLASNDPDDNPFVVALTGAAIAFPNLSIEQPAGNPLFHDQSSVDFGNVYFGGNPADMTFTLRNTGTDVLTGITPVIAGTNAADFAVVSPPASSLMPGQAATLVVRFLPSAPGDRFALLRVGSNDPEDNPFEIELGGFAIALPRLVVEQPVGSELPETNAQVNFGPANIGQAPLERVITLRNTGSGELSGLTAQFDGAPNGVFSIATFPASIVEPGGETAFTIRFAPTHVGSFQTVLRLLSNDEARSPFDITLLGTGATVPDIAVEQPQGNSLLAGATPVNFGDVQTGQSADRIFTLRNTGNAELLDIALSLTGQHASDFSVISPPPATLEAGANATFVLRFSPSGDGTRNAVARVASNDPDENPFDIPLTGKALAVPNLAVEQPAGTPLTHLQSTVSFGSAEVGTSHVDVVFSLRNDGSGGLAGLQAAFNGGQAVDFTVLTPPASTLLAGQSTTMVIRFLPSATGTRQTTLNIASNDPAKNPFVLTLSGQGVVIPNLVIERPAGTALVSGSASADLGATMLSGTPLTTSFTLRNTGTGTLASVAVSFTGDHPGDFNVVTAPPATLTPGQSSVFSIRFTPQAAGARQAVMRIASNDPDTNPFEIQVSGTGLAAPDITLQQPAGTSLTSGFSLVPFGSATVLEGFLDRIFTVRNDGTAALQNLSASLSGAGAADFQILSQPPETLEPGASATFSLRFAPLTGGDRACLLSVSSNDPDENPFTVTLTGFGVVTPNIAVEHPAEHGLNSGQSVVPFGTVVLMSPPAEREFTLRNTGTGPLTLSNLSFTGVNASDFSLAQALPGTLAAGAQTTFKLRFNPGAAGLRSASARILSDDPDTNPFVVLLSGEGLALPDIVVEQPAGQPLVNGSAAVAFGTVVLNAAPTGRGFTLRNTGTALLSNLTVSLTGDHAGDFEVLSFRDTPLAPGESSTFTISFAPSADGPRAAVLVIGSNDPDENPFQVSLSGSGLALPELQVEQPAGTELAAGDAVLDFGTVFVGGAQAQVEVTLRNAGTANLAIEGLTFSGSHPADFDIVDFPSNTIAPGDLTTFSVRYRPNLTGSRAALLTLTSNDPQHPQFVFHLAGESRDYLTEVFTATHPNDTAGATYTFRPAAGITPITGGSLPLVESAPETVRNGSLPDTYANATVLQQREVNDPLDPERRVIERLLLSPLKYGLLRVQDVFEVSGGKSLRMTQSAAAAEHVVVKAKPGVSQSQLLAALSLPGATVLKAMPLSGIWRLGFDSVDLDSLPDAVTALIATGLVEYAEPDLVVRAAEYHPNTPGFNDQWALHNTGQEGGKAGVDVGAPLAWNYISFGAETTPVAILDTGINLDHPAFNGQRWVNADEISANDTDDDNNGYIDDENGWNFAGENPNVLDDNGHGTRIAGIIGADGFASSNGAGLCWPAWFMPLKVLDSSGAGFTSDATEALVYAAEMGARVSCLAWGAYGYSRALQEAIEHADNMGCLVITAAGNDGRDIDRHPFFPATSNSENVLTAAAINRHGQLSWFSNHGAFGAHVGAPGSEILTTAINGHETFNGTSAAAAHVTGVCVMLMLSQPDLTHHEVRNSLLAGVMPLPSLHDKTATGGLLRADRALQGPHTFYFLPTHPVELTGPPGGPFSPAAATFDLTNPSATARSYELQADQPWINLSTSSGVLAAGARLNITASLGAGAALLPPGRHTAYVDLSTDEGALVWTREITLVVKEAHFLTRDAVSTFPIDPAGGAALPLLDDSFAEIVLADGASIPYFGKNYRSVFVGSNGYVSFGVGDWAPAGGAERHFTLPRLSAVFADLDPSAGGLVSWRQLADRLVITFENVPEHGGGTLNSFQFQLFFDGRLAVTILEAQTVDGVIGLSDGKGMPDDFMSSDFTGYPETGQGPPVFVLHPQPASALAGDPVQFTAVAEGAGSLVYQWFRNGLPIPDTTSSTLQLPSALVQQSGLYQASATNVFGTTTSQSVLLTVTKREATVQIENLAQTHNGAPREVFVVTNPPGLNALITYDGASSPPVDAGSYQIAAVIQDDLYFGSAQATLLVSQAAQSIDFPAIADQLAPATVNLAATGGASGNPVTFAVTTGPGVITGGNQLAFTGAGEVSITASQTGNANFLTAQPVTRTFNVSKATAAINLEGLEQTYTGSARVVSASTNPASLAVILTYDGSSDPPLNAGSYAIAATLAPHPLYEGSAFATLAVAKAAQQIDFPAISNQTTTSTVMLGASGGGSGNPVNFSVTAGPAVLSGGNSLTFTGAGSVTIAASQAGNANYLDAPQVTRAFNVTKTTASVTLDGLNQVYDGAPRIVTATTNPAGLNVLVLYGSSLVPRVNAGTYNITASISDPIYQGTATGTLVVAKAPQNISFDAPPDQLATAVVPLSASGGGSGNPVTFAVTGGPGLIEGSHLRFTGAGEVSVRASQPGGVNHLDAEPVTRTLLVSKTPALVNLSALEQTYDGTPRVAGVSTTPAGLTVTVTYDGNTDAPVNAGQYIVSATIDDVLYAGSETATLTVAKAAQTIDFPVIPNQSMGSTPTLSATGGGSGNPVTFSVTTGPATLTGDNQLQFTSAGEVSITASQAGNSNFEAATEVTRSFTVSELAAEIQLSALEQSYDGTPRVVIATTVPAGLEVLVTYNGSPNPPVGAGSYNINASIINSSHYFGNVSDTLTVSKAAQSIDFEEIASQLATTTLSLSATGGGSGNPVIFSVTSGSAVITGGNALSFTASGWVTVTANQNGDDNHLAAGEVTRTFQVMKASAAVTLHDLFQAPDGTPRAVAASTVPAGLPVQLTYDGSETAPLLPGHYEVTASVAHPLYQGVASGTLVLDHRADREIQSPEEEAETGTGEDVEWADELTGIYDGLLRDDADGHTLLGAIEKLTLSRARPGAPGGIASGRLRLNGRSLSLRGVFDANGLLSLNLPQKSGGPLIAELHMQQSPEGRGLITGTVRWNGVTARAHLPRAPFHARLNPAPAGWVGRYNVLIPSQIDWPAAAPVGDGWAAMTVSNAGVVKVKGRLGDGTPFTESAHLSAAGEFALFAELYRTTPVRGRMGGSLVFRDIAGVSDCDGVLQWRKLADTRERLHAGGFTVASHAVGSRHHVPASGARLLAELADSEPNASLSLSGPGLLAMDGGEVERVLGWLGNNTLRHFGPERISGKAARATGLVNGSYRHPSNGLRFNFTGVTFQKQGLVAGHFVAGGAAGVMRLLPGTDFSFPGSEGASSRQSLLAAEIAEEPPMLNEEAFDPAAAGVYHGVLNLGGAMSGGLENFSLSASGAFSGVLWVEGMRHAIKGVLDADGAVSMELPSGMTLTLKLLRVEGNEDAWQLAGTLTDGRAEHSLDAQRRPAFSQTARAPQEGAHTLVMLAPETADQASASAGDGYATLRVSHLGLCTGALVLPDGVRTTFAGHVSRTGEWSLHRGLYGTPPRGWLAGKITFRDVPAVSDLDGMWTWRKNAGATAGAEGHTVTRQVVGSRYQAPAKGQRAWTELADTWHNVWWRGGDLDRVMTWTTSNQIQHFGPDKLPAKFNANTGLVSGSYQIPGFKFTFGGVLVQKQGLVCGCRFSPGGSTRFNMEPR